MVNKLSSHDEEPRQLEESKWKEEINRLKSLRDEIIQKIMKKYQDPEQVLKQWEAIVSNFIIRAKVKMTQNEIKSYAAFHVLNSSSPTFERNPAIDLPGDLSIKKFLEEQLGNLS